MVAAFGQRGPIGLACEHREHLENPTVASSCLQSAHPGPVTLPSGRKVYWTGKLYVGLRYQRTPQDLTRDAEWLQDLLRKGL